MPKKIGINEVNFHGLSMDTDKDRLTVKYEFVFGNVLDKNDIQWIRKQLDEKFTLDTLVDIMSSSVKAKPLKYDEDGNIK